MHLADAATAIAATAIAAAAGRSSTVATDTAAFPTFPRQFVSGVRIGAQQAVPTELRYG